MQMTPVRRTLAGAMQTTALVIALALLAQPARAASCDFDSAKGTTMNPKQLNILLVGASGMIGSRVLSEATSRGHCVIAASRHPEKIAGGANVKAVKLDATDKDAFTAAAKKADVIVSATSPRGGGDPVKEAKAVGDAAIAAAQATGKRLMVVGGAGSLNTPEGKAVVDTLPPQYQGEARGMRAVLDSLKASNADWTFFSPAMSISPGKRTGKYQLGTTTVLYDAQKKSAISAEDFAHALVNELEKPAHRKSQMTIAYGS
jgi:putative NADH-flavin reductase